MKKLPRAYSRAKRKQQVIDQFNIWYHNGDLEPKTAYRIARALDLRAVSNVKNILDEMVMEGSLTVEKRDKSGRWTSDNYLVIKSLISEKLVKRRIAVKQRGVLLGTVENPFTQKELWS